MRTLGIGLYWDDLTVGEQFKTLNRTITEADVDEAMEKLGRGIAKALAS